MTNIAIPENVERIMKVLASYQYHATNEARLQSSIASVFDAHHIAYERERFIGKRDRVDFLVTAACGRVIAVEVKVKGTLSAVAMQVHRYAESTEVHACMLVTTLRRLMAIPREMAGKPVYVVRLPNGFM